MKDLLSNLLGYKKEIIIGPMFKLVEAIIEVLLPFLLANIIDKRMNLPKNKVMIFGIYFFILVIIGFFCAFLSQYFASKASQGVGSNIRNKLFNHINNLDNKTIDNLSTTWLTNTLTNDVIQIEVAVAMWIRLVIRVPFICIGTLVMCYIINPKYALIIFISMIFLIIATFFIIKKTVPIYNIYKEKLDNLSLRIKENLQNIRVIRSFVAQKKEIKKFEKENDNTSYYSQKFFVISRIIKSNNYINFKFNYSSNFIFYSKSNYF